MKRSLSLRSLVSAAAGVLLAVTLTPFVASPAQAAQWYSIAGSTYGNATYYCSTNIRIKAGSGPVNAKFSLIVPGGLRFGIASTACSLLSYSDFDTENNTQTIHSSISNSYQFKNMYRQLEYCQDFLCDHDFAGQEYY